MFSRFGEGGGGWLWRLSKGVPCGWVFVLRGNEKMFESDYVRWICFVCVRRDGKGRVVTYV